MNPVFVIGHRNPDTDSICSAICYAELKHRLTGEPYIPAGQAMSIQKPNLSLSASA